MILLLAVLAGLIAGCARALIGRRSLNIPDLYLTWLVPIAFLPQLIAFQLPGSRKAIPDELAAIALVGSQLLLLAFAWLNRRQPGLWLLGLGLFLNLVVIALNGGLMPISPETVERLAPNAPADAWQIGKRLGTGKDIVLPVDQTRLWWLSDRFLLAGWSQYRVAYSIGDVFIALGAFRLLFSLGRKREQPL